MSTKPSKFLRVVVIILLGMTAGMTLLGGIGTTCIAFNAGNFGEKWAPFLAVAPLMQTLVVVSIAAALYGVYAMVRLGKGGKNSYVQTLAFLLVGGAASAMQYYLSSTLRGSTAPNNMRLYITVFTLLVFLAVRLPGLWQRTGYETGARSDTPRGAGGAAMVVVGLITMTTPAWAMPTHLVDGYNTANVLFWPLLIGGAVLILLGGLVNTQRNTESPRIWTI